MLFARVAFLTFLGDRFKGESDLQWQEASDLVGLFGTGTNSVEVSFLPFADLPELEHASLFSKECITSSGDYHRGFRPNNTIKDVLNKSRQTVRGWTKNITRRLQNDKSMAAVCYKKIRVLFCTKLC